MVVDYDFTLGRNRLRGVGWRGLVALGLTLALRAATLTIITVSARYATAWLAHLLHSWLSQ
jgi:hypothetical protein